MPKIARKYFNIHEYLKLKEDEIKLYEDESISLNIYDEDVQVFRKNKKLRNKVVKNLDKIYSIQMDMPSINDYIPGEFKDLYIDKKGNEKIVQMYFKDMEFLENSLPDVDEFIKKFDEVSRKLNEEYSCIKKVHKLSQKNEEIYKILIVYKYMLNNMIYDKFYKQYTSDLPDSFLTKKDNLMLDRTQNGYGIINGKSVCSGFAYIFKNLLYKMGVDVKKVSGAYILDDGEMLLHEWIEKEIDGNNYLLNISSVFEKDNLKEKLFKKRKWEIPVFSEKNTNKYFVFNEKGKWENIKIHEKSLVDEMGEEEFYLILDNINFFKRDKKQIQQLEKIEKEMDKIIENESPLNRFFANFYDEYLEKSKNSMNEKEIKRQMECVLKKYIDEKANQDKKPVLNIEDQRQFLALLEILSEYSIKEINNLYKSIGYIVIRVPKLNIKDEVDNKDNEKETKKIIKQIEIVLDKFEKTNIPKDNIVYVIYDEPDIRDSEELKKWLLNY